MQGQSSPDIQGHNAPLLWPNDSAMLSKASWPNVRQSRFYDFASGRH